MNIRTRGTDTGRAPLAAWLPAAIVLGLLVLLVVGIVLTT